MITEELPSQSIFLVRYSLRLEHPAWLFDLTSSSAVVRVGLLDGLGAGEDLRRRNVVHYLVPGRLLCDAAGLKEHLRCLTDARRTEVIATHDM